ncbi:hypothetical protein [Halorientalis halophila]|uniref:hypothetical protein n=1 Tax=Halorientalis halophila TaxID=3108499 RepID=UPI0030084168
MTDDADPEIVPTTAYLPDHLVGGGSATIPTVRAADNDGNGDEDESRAETEATDADGPANATAEVCRSWRRRRSASKSFPF